MIRATVADEMNMNRAQNLRDRVVLLLVNGMSAEAAEAFAIQSGADGEEAIRKFYVPIGERTLDRWVSSGQFPRPDLALGGKARFWKRETVVAWIESQSQGGGQ